MSILFGSIQYLWYILWNELLVLLVEDRRGTGADVRERERMGGNGHSGPWYPLVFQLVPKEVLGTG
jgi:hypothetical protein